MESLFIISYVQQLHGTLPFWPFVISMLLIGAVLYSRAMNPNNWSLILRGTISPRAVQQLIREENIMENAFSGLLVTTFFFSLGLFFYNANEVMGFFPGMRPVFAYFIILISLFALYVMKVLSLNLFQWIFQLKPFFDEYLVGMMNANIVVGVLLIPLNLLMIYGQVFSIHNLLYLASGLFVMSFLIRYVRVVQVGLEARIKWYNIILYLCTLEIIPILLLVKLLGYVGISLNPG